MKVLKSFSIPELKIVKNAGESVKASEIKKEVLTKLQKSGLVSKPPQKASKK